MRRLASLWVLCLVLVGGPSFGFGQGAPERLRELTGAPLGTETLDVHFLDVGQGDAILVRTPSGQTILVDAGPMGADKVVLPYMKKLGVERLDAVVITHSHFDHNGGLPAILKAMPVGAIYYSGQVHPTPSNEKLFRQIAELKIPLVVVQPGYELPVKAPVRAIVMHPPKDWSLDDGTDINDTSVVLRISLGEIDFLLMGDAELLSESQVLSAAMTVEAEVLKLGHHGSHTASGTKFLDRVGPVVAVLFCAVGNRYKHPHEETLDSLRARSIRLLRTDQDGTVRIKTDGKSLRIERDGDESRNGRSHESNRLSFHHMLVVQMIPVHRPGCVYVGERFRTLAGA